MRNFIFITSIVLIISSCSKGPEFDTKPLIRFEKIVVKSYIDPNTTAKTDSITITLHFEDGDGDLGVDLSDTSESDNYYVTTFIKDNGTYSVLNLPIELGGKFEELAPTGYIGPIDGSLDYTILIPESAATSNPDLDKGDTLKFGVYISDEAGNLSNSIETDPVKVLE